MPLKLANYFRLACSVCVSCPYIRKLSIPNKQKTRFLYFVKQFIGRFMRLKTGLRYIKEED